MPAIAGVEEANDRGFVMRQNKPGIGPVVSVTASGHAFLKPKTGLN